MSGLREGDMGRQADKCLADAATVHGVVVTRPEAGTKPTYHGRRSIDAIDPKRTSRRPHDLASALRPALAAGLAILRTNSTNIFATGLSARCFRVTMLIGGAVTGNVTGSALS